MISAGMYKGRGVAGSQQFTTSRNGTDTMAVDLELVTPGGVVERCQTFLYLSPKAAQFSLERLRALGWDGANILEAAGIEKNEVNVQVSYETYEGKERMRVEIMAGGGRVEFEPMDPIKKRELAARVAVLMGVKPGSLPASVTSAEFPFGANTPNSKSGF